MIDTATFNAESILITRKRVPIDNADRQMDIVTVTVTCRIGSEVIEIEHRVCGDNVTVKVDRPVPDFIRLMDPMRVDPFLAQSIAETSTPTVYETIAVVTGNCKVDEYKSPLWFLRELNGKFYYIAQTVVEGKKYYGVTWYDSEVK